MEVFAKLIGVDIRSSSLPLDDGGAVWWSWAKIKTEIRSHGCSVYMEAADEWYVVRVILDSSVQTRVISRYKIQG